MKALKILKDIKIDEVGLGLELNPLCVTDDVEQAIEEIEALQNENKSLVKTLEKYKEEMIELRKENQDLPNTKPIQEGYYKRGGVNPPPPSQRPNFTPPSTKTKRKILIKH